MLSDLQKFLLDNPITDVEETVIVSERLKDFPFKIKCITSEQLDEYQKRCIKNMNNAKKRQVDLKAFNELVVINHCIEPNFRDAEWLQEAGCPTDPAKLLNKYLAAGEINKLSAEIQRLSGFDDVEQEETVEEVKNS